MPIWPIAAAHKTINYFNSIIKKHLCKIAGIRGVKEKPGYPQEIPRLSNSPRISFRLIPVGPSNILIVFICIVRDLIEAPV